jgi:GTPase
VALSKVDAVDEATLKQQTERLKRAIRSFGPPVGADTKRAKPLLLSTATRSGVTEVLRATMAAIEARRASESIASAQPSQWAPSV